MDPYLFLRDLAVVTSLAAGVLLVFRRLGWPPVLGYLAAGLIIGPHTPPFTLVADPRSLEAMAEIGVVFLLFALGAEFNFSRLLRSGGKALLIAGLQAAAVVVAGLALGRALGWGTRDALLLGGVASVASTAIVGRLLLERASRPSGWEELAAAVLIAEDMIAVLLVAVAATPEAAGSMGALAALAGRFAGLCMLVGVAGAVLIPRLLAAAERTGMEEVRTLSVVAVCFGVATLTHLFGFSAALGAFLAGAAASLGARPQALHEAIAPFRDVFGAVFFVSIGMLIDPGWLFEHWRAAAAVALGLGAARFGANFAAFALAGAGGAAALQASLARLPVGEFSFILAQTARKSGGSEQPVHAVAVALCLSTTLAASFLLPRATDARAEALIPRALEDALGWWRRLLGRAAPKGRLALGWTLAKPSLLQLAANALLVAGIALVCAGAAPLRALEQRRPGALWLVVSALSLPSIIAMARKLQAVTLILLEAALPSKDGLALLERHPRAGRAVPAAAALLAALGYLLVSRPLLPGGAAGAWAPLAVAALALALWRALSRLYSVVQSALRVNLARSEPEAVRALTALAESSDPGQVRLGEFVVRAEIWCSGKTLLETELRRRTGVMVLRLAHGHGHPVVPGPDTRLAAGDRLTLFGEPEALEAARRLLSGGPD